MLTKVIEKIIKQCTKEYMLLSIVESKTDLKMKSEIEETHEVEESMTETSSSNSHNEMIIIANLFKDMEKKLKNVRIECKD